MSIKKILLTTFLLLILVGGYFGYQFYQQMQPKPLPISEADRQAIRLMPLPAKLKMKGDNTFLELTDFFGAKAEGVGADDLRIRKAIRRMKKQIGDMTEQKVNTKSDQVNLIINCKNPSSEVPSLREDESYTLEVTKEKAVLNANTVYGVLRGVETFLQLIFISNDRTFVPTLKIEDNPRYPYRGLMIDVCRHWIPKKVILQNLDAMAAVKLNVLHLHLSEYQGFRVESKVFPKLHELGSNGNYYTQKDIQQIVKYAAERGIRVIPEFDLPGHSTSFLVGYPELAAAPGPYELDTLYGILPPVFDPTKEAVYTFLDAFFEEMATLFPDEYMHIGGDEVNTTDWENSPTITAFMKANNIADYDALHVYFNQRLRKILAKHGKKMMAWDEVLHPDLDKNVMVQSWRGHKFLFDAARQGQPTILSAGLYLDHKLPASKHYEINPSVLPGAVTIEPDSLNWQTWKIDLQVSETTIHGSMTLYGTGDQLRGVFNFRDNLQEFKQATLDNNNLAFSYESSYGKIDVESTIKADQSIEGTMGLGILSFPFKGEKVGGNDMAGTTAPPLEKIEPLTEEQANLILGGEACMWSEVVDENSINSRIWPRTAAIAEKLWSPSELTENKEDMYRRLNAFEIYLKERSFNLSSQYVLKLAKLTEKHPIFLQQVKDFVDLLEEVKYYNRMAAYKPLTTNIPLTEIADIARPESYDAKIFNQTASAYAANPSDQKAHKTLEFKLARMIENHQLLEPFFDHSPAMKKVEDLSLRLKVACESALTCLTKRNGNGLITKEERAQHQAAVEAAAIPQAGVEIAIIEGLRTLVNL